MQWEELYKARNSSEKMDAHLTPKKKKKEREKTETHCKRIIVDF